MFRGEDDQGMEVDVDGVLRRFESEHPGGTDRELKQFIENNF